MAYVDFDGAAALDAALRGDQADEVGEDFLREYCPRVTAAMDRVAGWLEQ